MFSRSAALYDAVYSFKDYAAEVAFLDRVIQERRPGARDLLDVACGTGRHLELLRERYHVEGVDLDERLLELAGGRLPGVPLHRADMVELDLGRRFDVVTCLFSSIGYVGTAERLERAVAALGRQLRPGGLLLVEPWLEPERWIVGRPGAVFVDEPDLKVARLGVSAREGDRSVLDFHYLVATPEGVESFRERHELGSSPSSSSSPRSPPPASPSSTTPTGPPGAASTSAARRAARRASGPGAPRRRTAGD